MCCVLVVVLQGMHQIQRRGTAGVLVGQGHLSCGMRKPAGERVLCVWVLVAAVPAVCAAVVTHYVLQAVAKHAAVMHAVCAVAAVLCWVSMHAVTAVLCWVLGVWVRQRVQLQRCHWWGGCLWGLSGREGGSTFESVLGQAIEAVWEWLLKFDD